LPVLMHHKVWYSFWILSSSAHIEEVGSYKVNVCDNGSAM